MKRIFLLLLVMIASNLIASEATMLLSVSPDQTQQKFFVQFIMENGIDICGYDRTANEYQLAVSPSDFELIRSCGIPFKILYRNMNYELRQKVFGQGAIVAYPGKTETVIDSTLGPYHTYAEMRDFLQQVISNYSSVSKLDTIGFSVENRPLLAIKISDTPEIQEPDEAEVLITGNHHAREVISVEICLDLIRQLTEGYGNDPAITQLVNNRQIWIIPMVNPDGHVYVEKHDISWRKNRRPNGDGSFGVDLNRNYGFMWGIDNIGSSAIQSSGVYRGTSPFSEPETRAIRDLVNAHNFSVCLSYHAYGNDYIYPWNYYDGLTIDQELYQNLSANLAGFNGYSTGNSWAMLNYLMNGEATDWMYGGTAHPVYALTVEVGTSSDGFLPDTSRIVPLLEQQRAANLFAIALAADPASMLPDVGQPTLESVLKTGPYQVMINWSPDTATVASCGGYRIYSKNDGNWNLLFNEQTLTPERNHISFWLYQNARFRVVAIDTAGVPGESMPSDEYASGIGPATERVLIVDGFDRTDGSWPHQRHEFVGLLADALDGCNIGYESCDNDLIIAGGIVAENYLAIIWLLGDESSENTSLSTGEQEFIRAYLENGGNLLISGSEIGSRLVADGNDSDRQFYSNYLKSEYLSDSSGVQSVAGATNTLFDGLNFGFGNISNGSPYPEESPDIIAPTGGSFPILAYSGINQVAGLGYSGNFGSSNFAAKLVYLPFPFETIHDASARSILMQRIMDYFRQASGISESIQETNAFRLSESYPNPFNSTTVLDYFLPQAGTVEFQIFNLIGQTVLDQNIGHRVKGTYQFIWDGLDRSGRSVASGVYYLRFRAGNFNKTTKLLLLR
jgi:hypothetical protein